MVSHDIFDMRDNPDPLDTTVAQFTDLDGKPQDFTIKNSIRMASLVFSGHHPLCADSECREYPVNDQQIGLCFIVGPISAEQRNAWNEKEDERIEKKLRKIGFQFP
jgi:hypothetical protein